MLVRTYGCQFVPPVNWCMHTTVVSNTYVFRAIVCFFSSPDKIHCVDCQKHLCSTSSGPVGEAGTSEDWAGYHLSACVRIPHHSQDVPFVNSYVFCAVPM